MKDNQQFKITDNKRVLLLHIWLEEEQNNLTVARFGCQVKDVISINVTKV